MEIKSLNKIIMKKRILVLAAAVACAFSFSACDGNIEGIFSGTDILGHITLYTSNPTNGAQAYNGGDTLRFASAMCNANVDSVYINAGEYSGSYDIHIGTVMVGTTDNLLTNDVANITFPLCGVNVRDTTTGTFAISCPINDFSFFEYLDTTDYTSMINTGLAIGNEMGNLFVVAVSEEAFYLGYAGSITFTHYGGEGALVQGSVNDVDAIYVTKDQISTIANMSEAERAEINLGNYFPHITFAGEISSRRANIAAVMQALDEME